MCQIGLSKLILVFLVSLIVLGPERLLGIVKVVINWICVLRSIAISIENELSKEFKMQKTQKHTIKHKETINKNSIDDQELLNSVNLTTNRYYISRHEKNDDKC